MRHLVLALGDQLSEDAAALDGFHPVQDARWMAEVRVVVTEPGDFRVREERTAAVEGFVRQILGWREYVRGLYWHGLPGLIAHSALAADRELPRLYWTAATDLACLRDTLTRTLEFGYAHHIERLMVTGLFALLLGVEPEQVHEW